MAALPSLLVLLLLGALPAMAHSGGHPLPATPWLAWSWDPWVVVPLALSGALYALGVGRLWARASVGAGLRRWRAGMFALGWLAAAIALVTAVDVLGEELFWVHMIQHEILILVAAPLLVLGLPQTAFVWAVPPRWRQGLGGLFRRGAWRALWRAASNPLGAWLIHAALLWGWHAPALFEASLRSDGMHTLQHLSFFASALLFWAVVLRGGAGGWGKGVAALSVFTTAMHSSALGALLTFSASPWYPTYRETAPRWGLTALEDQQLGGLIMWVPGGVVFLVAGLALVGQWLQDAERRARA
ncbi:cytochrome c oxidase assembly protein [Novispirillum sp. DQ9]|uniref:cytochrome c oxidase assembly protein n=1 Tax=Novispirillum sp. DQ9 TaxID=3398612 RepID=UPI003C7C1E70